MSKNQVFKNGICLGIFCLLFSCSGFAQQTTSDLLPYRLLTSGRENPLEVSLDSLRFSWSLGSSRQTISWGSAQRAFSVKLWDVGKDGNAKRKLIWESGCVEGANVRAIPYSGPQLKDRWRYTWNLRVWDEESRPSKSVWARFETAAPPTRPIRGSWIGSGGEFKPLEFPPEGFLSSTVLEKDVAHHIVIDLGRLVKADKIVLHPASPFRAATDLTGMGFPKKFVIKTSLSSRLESFETVSSSDDLDLSDPVREAVSIKLKRRILQYVLLESKERYALPERSFVSLGEIEVFESGKNVALGCPVYVSDETVSRSYKRSFLVDGIISKGEIDRRANGHAAFLSKTFVIEETPNRALLRLAVLGVVDIWINGVRLKELYFGPCDSVLGKRVYYQTWNISKYIKEGRNRIDLILGHGKAGGQVPDNFSSEASSWKTWPCVVAELAFGSGADSRIIGTDSTWKVARGYVLDQGLANGETHDGGSQSKWLASLKNDTAANFEAAVVVTPEVRLIPQYAPPWSLLESVAATHVDDNGDNKHLVDFGRNLSGTFRIRLRGKAGARVVIDLREQLNSRGQLDLISSSWSTFGRFQHYEFVLSGEEDTFEPRLSMAGFRYMEVTLPQEAKILGTPMALMIGSEMKPTLKFTVGQEDLMKLRQMSVATLQSCRHGTPVDCPQRERSGWLLDGYMTARSFMPEWDSDLWYRKWLGDMVDAQNDSGFVPSAIPSSDLFDGDKLNNLGHFADPWWGGVLCFLAVDFYEFYGDRDFLMSLYPSMKKWVEFLKKRSHGLVLGWGLGDWHEPHGKIDPTPIPMVATAGYHRAVVSCEKAAEILGKEGDRSYFRGLRDGIRKAWGHAFPQGGKTGLISSPRESGQIIALAENLVTGPPREALKKGLVQQLGRGDDCHLNTGYVTTPLLFSFLLSEGLGDTVLDVLLNRSEASWMRFLDLGHTTMPERWIAKSDSLNHLPLSFVSEVILRLSGFCQPTLEKAGFARFQVWPQAMERLGQASWEFESPRGRIACSWRYDKSVTMTLVVPPGCECALVIPATSLLGLTINKKSISELGRIVVSGPGDFRRVLLPSGEFHLTYGLEAK